MKKHSELTIKTNHHWRPYISRYEIPEDILSEFDWMLPDGKTWEELEDYQNGFFKYRGDWYHNSEFMRTENSRNTEFDKYDGYYSDSFFSGILIKLSDNGEMYQVATYCS